MTDLVNELRAWQDHPYFAPDLTQENPEDLMAEAAAAIETLRSVLSNLATYTDAHRVTVTDCAVCSDGRCYEEWSVMRDEVRRVTEPTR